MNRFFALISLLLVASFNLSCGGSGRQLQSISISQTVNGDQIQFVATGTFSAAPTTVSPLSVEWTVGLMAPPPPQYTYTLTTQPFTFQCTGSGPYLPVVAFAPPEANAPSSGSTKKVVQAVATVSCP
jgi:hypothetical protein